MCMYIQKVCMSKSHGRIALEPPQTQNGGTCFESSAHIYMEKNITGGRCWGTVKWQHTAPHHGRLDDGRPLRGAGVLF